MNQRYDGSALGRQDGPVRLRREVDRTVYDTAVDSSVYSPVDKSVYGDGLTGLHSHCRPQHGLPDSRHVDSWRRGATHRPTIGLGSVAHDLMTAAAWRRGAKASWRKPFSRGDIRASDTRDPLARHVGLEPRRHESLGGGQPCADARLNMIWSITTDHVAFGFRTFWSVRLLLFMPEFVYGMVNLPRYLSSTT